jgi:hypothetical protein
MPSGVTPVRRIVEISHRGPEFMVSRRADAERDLRTLLSIPDDYAVLFTRRRDHAAGADPLNFAAPGQPADYVVTGHWGKTALKQAGPYVAATSPPAARPLASARSRARSWQLAADAAYVHITANETIHGVEFRDIPDVGDVPLFADFSSSIASRAAGHLEVRRDLRRRAEEPRPGRHQRRDRAARPARTRRPAARRHLRLPLAAQGRVDAQHAADLELVPARA